MALIFIWEGGREFKVIKAPWAVSYFHLYSAVRWVCWLRTPWYPQRRVILIRTLKFKLGNEESEERHDEITGRPAESRLAVPLRWRTSWGGDRRESELETQWEVVLLISRVSGIFQVLSILIHYQIRRISNEIRSYQVYITKLFTSQELYTIT